MGSAGTGSSSSAPGGASKPQNPSGLLPKWLWGGTGWHSSSLAVSPSRAGRWLHRVTRVPWVSGASPAARTHPGLPPPSRSGLGILRRGAPRATPQPLSPGWSGTGDSSLLSHVASTQKFYLLLILTRRPCSGTRGWHLPGAAALCRLLIGPCHGIWVARALSPSLCQHRATEPPPIPPGRVGDSPGIIPVGGMCFGIRGSRVLWDHPVSCGIIPCPRGCPRVCPTCVPAAPRAQPVAMSRIFHPLGGNRGRDIDRKSVV